MLFFFESGDLKNHFENNIHVTFSFFFLLVSYPAFFHYDLFQGYGV